MKILEFAMEKEKNAEQLYRELASKAPDPSFASILTLLAEAEHKHLVVLQQVQARSPELGDVETDILPQAKETFVKMAKAVTDFDFTQSEIALYEKAQQLEAETRDFYLGKSNEVDTDAQKNLFLRLAEEEKKHYFLLDNIIEFLSRPHTWLENAEWRHLDEY